MTAISDLLSPEVQSFQWMPVYIEPIPFSGERLCAAIVFRTEDGQTKTVSTEAIAMRRLVHELNASLDAHARTGGELAAWTPPFDNVYRSAVRTVRETSLDAAMATIISNSSSVYRPARDRTQEENR